MTLTDQLLQKAELHLTSSTDLDKDVKTLNLLSTVMPRVFPRPDIVYTTNTESEYPVVLLYLLKLGEQSEPLRKLLSMTFGANDWECELENKLLSLRTTCMVGDLNVTLKIVGADTENYTILNPQSCGLKLVGKLACRKFMPWDILRDDATPEILVETCYTKGLESYTANRQAKILSELAHVLPELPVADGVAAGFGLNHDADITYVDDPKGKKRAYLDNALGYTGWAAIVDKKTAVCSLHTTHDIICRFGTLRLRVSIVNACLSKEKLFLMLDLPNVLVYRAIRNTDPDYKAVTRQLGVKK
jgi:hypothetical protein